MVQNLAKEARSRFLMASPYIGKDAHEILQKVRTSERRLIVDLSKASVGIGATDPWAVEDLMKLAETKKLAELHAKIFVFDNFSIIGSANLSWNAFFNRIEVGVLVDDRRILKKVISLFEKFWNAAEKINAKDIAQMKRLWNRMKTGRTKIGLGGFERTPPKPANFVLSKSQEDLKKAILEGKPDETTFKNRKKAFERAHNFIIKLKERDLSKKEIQKLLEYLNQYTGAISPVGSRNINLILGNNKRKLNKTFRNLLDEGEDISDRIDDVVGLTDKLSGIDVGVVSSLLFAYNPEKYCIYNKSVFKGLSEIFRSAKDVYDGQSYIHFNLLANRVKTKFKVSHIELDHVLWNMAPSS